MPMSPTTICEPALCKSLETRLVDRVYALRSFELNGHHHKTYIATTHLHGQIFVRVQWSFFKTENCGMVSPKSLPSEVATMRYVRKHTRIPVPEVLAFDMDEEKCVGGAWMATEYVDGENLSCMWVSLTMKQKELICLNMADIWSSLLQLTFSSIGSIFEDDKAGFSIGPMMRLPSGRSGALSPPRAGPFATARDWLLAQARHELDYVYPSHPADGSQSFIDTVISDIQSFVFPSPDLPFVLEHIDFSFRNFIVARDDPTRIVAVVDWEGARVVPMWAAKGGFSFPWAAQEPLQSRKHLRTLIQNRLFENNGHWRRAVGPETSRMRMLNERSQVSDSDPAEYIPEDVLPFSPDVREYLL